MFFSKISKRIISTLGNDVVVGGDFHTSDEDSASSLEGSDLEDEVDDLDQKEAQELQRNDPAINKDIQKILDQFYVFLQGPDKGTKERSNYQRYHDVKRIVIVTKPANLSEFLVNDARIVKEKYIMNYCANHQPKPIGAGSISKYMSSLLEFVDFIILEKISTDLDIHSLNSVKIRIKLWRKKLNRVSRLDKHRRDHIDEEMLVYVSQEQVLKYEHSEHASKTRELFQTILNSRLTRTKFCRVRDHLYSLVHFSNSHRSGVTANMTLEEFQKAKQDKDGIWTILVWDHKTVSDYGPANVELTSDSYELLNTFVNQIRPKMKIIKSNNVFLSWEGKRVTSGIISIIVKKYIAHFLRTTRHQQSLRIF